MSKNEEITTRHNQLLFMDAEVGKSTIKDLFVDLHINFVSSIHFTALRIIIHNPLTFIIFSRFVCLLTASFHLKLK